MATVVNRTTKRLVRSVNTPEYSVDDWIINPDLSAVGGVPSKYWVITGDVISLMDQAGRDAVDVALFEAALASDRTTNRDRMDSERILKALALTIMDEINILRAQHSLSARTQTQLVTAIKAKVDEI